KKQENRVLLNFKGLRRLLGKRQRLLAYLAKKNRSLDFGILKIQILKKRISRSIKDIIRNCISEEIHMNFMEELEFSWNKRGNSIGVLKDPILFLVLAGIFGIFCEKKETPLFIVDKTKSLLTPLDILFPHKDIEYNEPSLVLLKYIRNYKMNADFIFGPEASKSVPHKKVVLQHQMNKAA
ncbi:hypothetical protein ACJX0J_004074, partial [Zea mays]